MAVVTPELLALRDRLTGSLLFPTDPDYATATSGGFHSQATCTPVVVVLPDSTADVVLAVQTARSLGLKVAVQTTGHGTVGAVAGGMLLSMRALDQVTIDTEAQTARIGGGATWGQVQQQAVANNLFATTGSSDHVGVVGFLLGGGIGPVVRTHGAGSDYMVAATLVTGRGDVVTVSAQENPALFWALRGGKYGFGIVTEVTVRLVPVPDLYAGAIAYPAAALDQVLHQWTDWQATADSRVSTSIALFHFPPLPTLPEAIRGQSLLFVRFAFPFGSTEGERLAAPLRAFGPIVMDTIGPLPADQCHLIHSDPIEPGPYVSRGFLLDRWDHDAATVLVQQMGQRDQTPLVAFEIRQLGGAFRADVPEGSAVSGRSGSHIMNGIGVALPGLTSEAQVHQAIDELEQLLGDRVSSSNLVNFAEERRNGDLAVWPRETIDLLTAIRTAHDPDTIFV
ncbi:MAG TPA: FAD-binding oxidoreductase [Thermomicrobiales bacterium]|nr:FAD-binding oxidoreductase [Thermomicrobiales bacterium]